MSEKVGLVAKALVTDPDNVPVRSINGGVAGVMGSVVILTLTTNRVMFDADGNGIPDIVIAARLRFDLEVAKTIRDQLNIQIGALSVRPDDKAN